MSKFVFHDCDDVPAVLRAEVPPNIKSEEALLNALAVALRFPEYFGMNWNAVDECICDLSWLPPGDVVLKHADLPLADDLALLSVYLAVLRGAVENWALKGSNLICASPEKWDATGERALLVKRKFFVVFQPSAERVLERCGMRG